MGGDWEMNVTKFKNNIGRMFNVINSSDTIYVVSVDYKNKLYNCEQTYDGQCGGKEFFRLDVPFHEFEQHVETR